MLQAAITVPTRNLNLMEFQSKNLLDKHNVCIQKFKMAENTSDAVSVSKEFSKFKYILSL